MVDTDISVHQSRSVRVRVLLGPLRSVIGGGIQQTASRSDNVTLDGRQSEDPDDPDDKGLV